jgi:hypothetical protein
LVHFKSVAHRNLDGVARSQAVELECHLHTVRHELAPHVPVGMEMINCVPADLMRLC